LVHEIASPPQRSKPPLFTNLKRKQSINISKIKGKEKKAENMFRSISKAWSEVADESMQDHSVRFSPSSRQPAQHEKHYIHYDKPSKNPLDRVRRNGEFIRRGSPRVLKPSNENKKNSGIWGTLGKIGKAFKGENTELNSMKSYMDGMITKRPQSGTTSRRLDSIRSRAESINDRAERFARENASPERPSREQLRYQETKRPQMRRIYLKDLSEAESSRDSISEKVQRRPLRSSAIDTPSVLPHHDVPSSPYTHKNDSARDSSEVRELSKKVSILENTLESLIVELRNTNERSQQLENSLRLQTEFLKSELSNHTILKSEDMDRLPEPKPEAKQETALEGTKDESEDEFEEVNKSLSPVKLDLKRFKFIN
jgi:hypothetical protein